MREWLLRLKNLIPTKPFDWLLLRSTNQSLLKNITLLTLQYIHYINRHQPLLEPSGLESLGNTCTQHLFASIRLVWPVTLSTWVSANQIMLCPWDDATTTCHSHNMAVASIGPFAPGPSANSVCLVAPPKKGQNQKMSLGDFLTDECKCWSAKATAWSVLQHRWRGCTALGSWADEMENMPVARKYLLSPILKKFMFWPCSL